MAKRITSGAAAFLLDAACMGIVGWAAGRGVAGLPAACITLLSCYALGLYRREAIAATRVALGRLPLAVGFGVVSWAMVGAVVPAVARVGAFPFLFAGLLAAGAISRAVLAWLRARGFFRAHLLVLGAGRRAWELALLLRREGRNLAYELVFLHDPALGPVEPRLLAEGEVVVEVSGSLLAIAQSRAAEAIVVAPDERRGMRLDALLECKIAGIPIVEYLTFLERETRRIDLKRLDLSWILFADGFFFGMLDRALKRAADVLISFLLLAIVAPFLLAAMALVWLDDGAPVFYRQQRVTRHGVRFHILKLRTMRRDAEARGAVWAAERDPRITRIGTLLRRTRLDELPQLFNILRGDMSFVGPRPERPEFVDALSREIPLYAERHAVKAGLTGWAQINYPYGASLDDARSKLSYDLYYIKNFSILFDILIIMQTLRAVLWPSGVR
jgi:sugar transferase (PEP-CTERM system associated)